MLTHLAMSSTLNALYHSSLEIKSTDSHLSFLPLSHIFERLVMYNFLARGGEVCFYQGDPLKLAEDLKLYRPTVIAIVPRLINKIYGMIKDNFAK